METIYTIRESENGFYVGHVDSEGEWWDADPSPFATREAAEAFRAEIQGDTDEHD